MNEPLENEAIAIIGMDGRFPGAGNLDEYWDNLIRGRDCLTRFADGELDPAIPETERAHPDYVPVRGVVKEADCFDAAFFGISPREAEILDPQQRLFLETAWRAMEHAGYAPGTHAGLVGVFAGMSNNTYLNANVARHPDVLAMVGDIQAMVANEKDYVATRTSYKLDLHGPSINVCTACSTSLVAVCHAFYSLLDYQCDLALAGAMAISCPQERGYVYREGSILSPDGKVHAFDASASGTVFGNGGGVIVLKRLSEALADGDTIHAVIRGVAMNNDGADRVSFTAPSVEGQSRVVQMAQEMAGVDPEEISYVETHGTGTSLGDPIEVAALTQAFRRSTDKRGFCGIGTVKPAIGHLDVSAGIAGLLKTVLALRHELIPATLNFATANPELNLEDSPFRVIAEATPWPANASPRRAGVSAFGLGGTNAHVILEEAPPQAALAEPDEAELLVLSAKTEPALNRLSVAMADYLETDDETPLADIAHTLQVGRQAMGVRRALVCRDRQAAAATLRKTIAPELITALALDPMPRPVFMFPGQGSQRAGMGASIYAAERVFREAVDRCAAILEPLWKLDVRELMFGRVADADRLLTETRYTQPALFTIEYALARQWMHWGLRPVALVGHSIGEFVAATVADIMRLEDALPLVAERGRLMQEQPGGGMLSIRLPESELAPWLGEGIELAGVNAPRLCVVAGSHAAVDALGKRLDEAEVAYSRLHTSHAFHSDSMAPVVEPFRERVAALKLSTPAIPVISTVTGQPLADEEATDPQYWARQLRLPVRFHSAVSHLLDSASALFLEVGPGLAASTFARQAAAEKSGAPVVESLGRPDPEVSEHDKLLQAAGGVWARGVPLDWQRMRQGPRRHRVPLPMYSFERTRYWLETTGVRSQPETEEVAETRSAPIDPAASGASVMEQLQAALREATGLGADTLPPAGRFSELGLDSLFLTQFSQLLRQRFHLELRLRDLLGAYDNLAALASLIEEQTRAAPAAAPATGNGHANAPARGTPPRPDARLGRRPDGRPAWFIPDPERPGAYRELRADT